jgi:hypothetical protein
MRQVFVPVGHIPAQGVNGSRYGYAQGNRQQLKTKYDQMPLSGLGRRRLMLLSKVRAVQ